MRSITNGDYIFAELTRRNISINILEEDSSSLPLRQKEALVTVSARREVVVGV